MNLASSSNSPAGHAVGGAGAGGSTADEALVAGLSAGDERVFQELFRRKYPMMKRVARGYVDSDALAEEVVQETWLAVINGISGFEGRSSLDTWIFSILVNRARSQGVRERRSVPFSSIGPADSDEPSVG
jgi:RNA polymerase sigma-70 factor (ECF subfamily)